MHRVLVVPSFIQSHYALGDPRLGTGIDTDHYRCINGAILHQPFSEATK
jgi:hypothetical protein